MCCRNVRGRVSTTHHSSTPCTPAPTKIAKCIGYGAGPRLRISISKEGKDSSTRVLICVSFSLQVVGLSLLLIQPQGRKTVSDADPMSKQIGGRRCFASRPPSFVPKGAVFGAGCTAATTRARSLQKEVSRRGPEPRKICTRPARTQIFGKETSFSSNGPDECHLDDGRAGSAPGVATSRNVRPGRRGHIGCGHQFQRLIVGLAAVVRPHPPTRTGGNRSRHNPALPSR